MTIKTVGLGLATFVGGIAALTAAAVAIGRRQAGTPDDAAPAPLDTTAADGPAPSREQVRRPDPAPAEGHAAPDLAPGATPGEPVPAAFRPDMDAAMTPAEREALRPAIGPSPTLVDAGTSQPG